MMEWRREASERGETCLDVSYQGSRRYGFKKVFLEPWAAAPQRPKSLGVRNAYPSRG